MHWRLEDVWDLPEHVYQILVEELNKEADRAGASKDFHYGSSG